MEMRNDGRDPAPESLLEGLRRRGHVIAAIGTLYFLMVLLRP